MWSDMFLIAVFGPHALTILNGIGMVIAFVLLWMRYVRKIVAGFQLKHAVMMFLVMVVMAVWLLGLVEISLLPLFVLLLLAFLLPEILHLLMDFSYIPSIFTSLSILCLTALAGVWISPFWIVRQEASLISAILMLLAFSAIIGVWFLFTKLTVGLEGKTEA